MVRFAMARTPQAPDAETFLSPPPLPGWARNEPRVTDTEADTGAAFQAGAALAMLDGRVRAGVPFAGVWRRRLALKAAAASARITRRGEDEATLRDVFFLRHGGDDPGPAGRMLVAWRGLDRSAPLQIKVDDALRAAIADVQQLAASPSAAPFAAAQAARIVVMQRPDAEILALWLVSARCSTESSASAAGGSAQMAAAAAAAAAALSGRCRLDAHLLRRLWPRRRRGLRSVC
jgi:hypothetical protein